MSRKDTVKLTQIILASISLAICIFFWGRVIGIDQGYLNNLFVKPPGVSEIQLSSGGPNFFEVIPAGYSVVCIGFILSIIGTLQKELSVSTGINLFSSGLIILSFWNMLTYKIEILSIKTKLPFDYAINQSIYFDCFCLLAAVSILAAQIILFITNKGDEINLNNTAS